VQFESSLEQESKYQARSTNIQERHRSRQGDVGPGKHGHDHVDSGQL